MVHLNVAQVAFLCALLGTIVLSLRFRGQPQLGPVSTWLLAIAGLALVPLLLLRHSGFGGHALGGLYERLFLALELLWILVVGLTIHKSSRSAPQHP